MAYNIEYDPKALKELKKLDKSIALSLLDGIEEFAQNPLLSKIKKLKTPFDGAYRLRIGNYRIIFYQEENLMLISKIAHRKDIYI
ncbi:MAG: type II toxin-antitoxin system RelE/ParE family toxin [Sulfurimonas sp.]|nr:type II toxin-antitoxin system RelE/ParE family toxin [Sulfurimonas sp.]